MKGSGFHQASCFKDDYACYVDDLILQLCALPHHKQHLIHYCLGKEHPAAFS